MSWGTAWRNSWSGTWGDGISLTVSDTVHAETADSFLLANITLSVAENGIALTSDNTELTQANTLVVGDAIHLHYIDSILLSQSGLLSIYYTIHTHTVDNINYFSTPELRLNGSLFGNSGLVTVSGVQCAVFSGIDLYPYKKWGTAWGDSWGNAWGSDTLLLPILQRSSIAINDGQIAIRDSGFSSANIGNSYLVIFYKPGTPRVGGGPYPAIMVDANA